MIKLRRLRCSFCRKNDSEVLKLVAGPRVYICNECVAIASRMMADDGAALLREHQMTGLNSEGPIMYVPRMDAVLNRWFTSYTEASSSLASEGGFLLPYKGQFFVTLREGIRELGLDPDDPDWERIGWDWVQPKDSEAWQRLKEKREQVG